MVYVASAQLSSCLSVHYTTHDTRLTHGQRKLRLAEDFEMLRLTPDFEMVRQAQHFKIFCQMQFSLTMRQTCIMSGIVYTWSLSN